MTRLPGAPLLLVGALVAQGCDAATPLAWLGVRGIREVPVERAAAWLAEGRARLVQLRERQDQLPWLLDADALAPDDPVPASWAGQEGWLLVVASEREPALRLAARLARAGVPRVGVVTGEVRALADAAAARRADLQPPPPARHPSN